MINIIPGSELLAAKEAEDAERTSAEDEANNGNEAVRTGLVGYVRSRWEDAVKAKRDVEKQMLKNKRQRNGEYESDKLAAIKKMGSAENFVLLTDTKCRSGLAWIKDVLFQPGMKPWSLEPTPEPDLPDELEMQIVQEFTNNLMSSSMEESYSSGSSFDPYFVLQEIQNNMPDIKNKLREAYYKRAKENSKITERHIDDQLVEGGWYNALEECLEDLVELKACVFKGPILRTDKIRQKRYDKDNQKPFLEITEEIRPYFERRSPFDIYPAPDACNVDDGYLFDKIKLSKKGLYDLIGLPGFNESEIRLVLEDFETGNLKEWTGIETERTLAEGKDTSAVYMSEKIDCLEFWDFIPGNILLEWGMSEIDVTDKDDSYPVCVWLIGNHIIKAMLNYDPFGHKPFSVTSFEKVVDSIWGKGLPELISDIQGVCNAVVRAIVNNVGLASGPQVEVNKQRFPVGYPMGIWPWKVWESSDTGLSTAPALKVNHIPLNADKLIMIYNHFSKLADEESGVPAYSHGDPQVGGAGNTASGLSMLMTHAARGIKSVIRSIDKDIIATSIERLYYLNMEMEDNEEYIFDYHIVARGSSSLIAKEQQAVRLVEFLNATNNPVDFQIMGADGRQELLKQAAQAQDIDTDRILPEGKTEQLQLPQQGIPSEQFTQQSPATLDAAGNRAQGEDTRLISHEQAPQQAA